MGLDQNWFAYSAEPELSEHDEGTAVFEAAKIHPEVLGIFTENQEIIHNLVYNKLVMRTELGYHRKVPFLHGFMANEYANTFSGTEGYDEGFNCTQLFISSDILDSLSTEIERARKGTSVFINTKGFFFGEHCPEDVDEVESAVKRAREAISSGAIVSYSAWY